MADLTFSGFKELAEAMQALPQRVATNALRRSVAAGARVIRDEAKMRAPVDTGEMRRDIKIKRERVAAGLSARYSVFVLSGKASRIAGKARNVDKNSFYWRFIEFGTAKMSAKPFMRPAFEAKKTEAVQKIADSLGEAIEHEAEALAKR